MFRPPTPKAFAQLAELVAAAESDALEGVNAKHFLNTISTLIRPTPADLASPDPVRAQGRRMLKTGDWAMLGNAVVGLLLEAHSAYAVTSK